MKNKMKLFYTLSLFVFVYATMAKFAMAETPEEKGLSIAKETERRDMGFGDSVVEATMVLKDRSGVETTRKFNMKTFEETEDGDKTLATFDAPLDLAGTAVLTWSHALTPDDQWLYLPAVKRIKRIASKNKAAAFIGSEFAFEDLSSFEVRKFRYRFLKEENQNGVDCLVVENTPAYADSAYSRQIECVDKAIYHPRRIDYYDQEGKLFKSMEFRGYHQYLNKHWRPTEQIMTNHQTGKSTRIVWDQWRFKTGLSKSNFTPQALEQAR